MLDLQDVQETSEYHELSIVVRVRIPICDNAKQDNPEVHLGHKNFSICVTTYISPPIPCPLLQQHRTACRTANGWVQCHPSSTYLVRECSTSRVNIISDIPNYCSNFGLVNSNPLTFSQRTSSPSCGSAIPLHKRTYPWATLPRNYRRYCAAALPHAWGSTGRRSAPEPGIESGISGLHPERSAVSGREDIRVPGKGDGNGVGADAV